MSTTVRLLDPPILSPVTTAELTRAGSAAPPPRHPARSWWDWLPPGVLFVLGAAVLLRGHPLWFDELYTAEVTRLPLSEIVRAILDGHGTTSYLRDVPPSYNAPYYLLVKLWVELPFGGSNQSLRMLSLLAATVGVAALARAVTRLAGAATGVMAGLMIAANPLLLKQAVEARSYGFVVLATAGALLGLARWLDGAPGGLLLFGVAGCGMGLAHWYAVLVLAAFALAGFLVGGRRAGPLMLIAGVALLPTAGLVLLNLLTGNGDRNAAHLVDTRGMLSSLAVQAWAGNRLALLVLTVVLAVVALVRVRGLRLLGAVWVGLPLVALTLVEVLVRPVYTPRYLLPALIGLGVLAAAGAVAWPRRVALPLTVALVTSSILAVSPVLQRPPRERGDEVVALLAQRQHAGEPVVAVDSRSALALDHFGRLEAPRLAADLRFPPDDPPAGADRVWLVRRHVDGEVRVGDDDAVLLGDGLRVVEEIEFPGSATDFVVQRWER
jgi:mannosyltransferase